MAFDISLVEFETLLPVGTSFNLSEPIWGRRATFLLSWWLNEILNGIHLAQYLEQKIHGMVSSSRYCCC